MTESVSFDRAADYYDQTRSLPEPLMEKLVGLLVAELPDGGRCLEIGIGTGRIALPLRDRGIDVVGVDISLEMVRRYVAKAPPPANVAIADATHLPFEDRTFTSAIASHVFHLIPEWKTSVDELLRVLVPGGVVLASRSADPGAEWQNLVRRHFYVEAGDPPWPPGMNRIDELDQEMSARKASIHKLDDVRNDAWSSVADLIDMLEKGIYAACWAIDVETRLRAAAVTRQWASREIGDLNQRRRTRSMSDWRAYRLPE